jgi:hypothetical protein
MKEYKFLVRGTTQTTRTSNPVLIAMIEGAIAEFPMEIDPWGRYIVTNEFLFDELMKQIQEALK